MYYDEKVLNATKIAKILGIEPRTAQRVVSKDPRYEEYKEKKYLQSKNKQLNSIKQWIKQNRREKKKEQEQLEKDITDDFFNNQSCHDIWTMHTEYSLSKKYNVALDKVVNILKKNNKYAQLQNHRKITENTDLEIMHIKDVLMMSKRTVVSDNDCLKYLNSAYRLSVDRESYIYNEQVGAKPYDIPNTINTRSILQQKEKQRIEREKHFSSVEMEVINN